MTAERRYALVKLDAGRWLLYGNDVEVDDYGLATGGTVFRFARWEDGPHLGAERRRTVWTLTALPFPAFKAAVDRSYADPIGVGDPIDAVEWEHVAEHPTRKAAIAEAVSISEARRQAQEARA